MDVLLFRTDSPLVYELSDSPHFSLAVYALETAAVYDCPHGISPPRPIRTEPLDLLSDLEKVGKMTVETTDTRLDGRQAWLLTVSASSKVGCHSFLSVLPIPNGQGATLARSSSRSWLLRVGRTTILVQTWAGAGEWAKWTPIASQMVESIHFLDE